MTDADGTRNLACGHLGQPDARFCPVCGHQTAAAGSVAPSEPSTVRLSAPPAPSPSASPPGANPPSASAAPPQPALPPSASPTFPPLPKRKSPSWDSWYAPPPPSSPPSGPPAASQPASPGGTRPQPTPPAGVPSPPAGPYATQPNGPGPASRGDPPTAILGDLRPAPSSGAPQRSRRLLVPAITAAALVTAVTGAVVLWAHPGGTAASGTAATGTTPSASSQATRRQAAVRLSGLLAQSVTDRAAVIDAVVDVRSCGPSLHQDVRIFTRAASSRRYLLSRLGSLPGRSLLPAAMLHDLAGAWQASAEADTDLARWAAGKIARGCHRNGGSDASLRASYVFDSRATTEKQAFTSLWNPVARQYGLTTYQWYHL